MKTYDENGLSTAAVALVTAGAVIGGSIGLVAIGFPGAIASAILGAFCGVVLTDSLD
jgi:hypothetical protein